MSKEIEQGYSTADFAAAAEQRAQPMQSQQGEPLAALFAPDQAQDFRSRWDQVQIGFVDDPGRAVQQADELVAHVMKTLAESFAAQRSAIEQNLAQGEQGSTENQRVALQRYRSFFQRLLSL
jgi:hypothetical protein